MTGIRKLHRIITPNLQSGPTCAFGKSNTHVGSNHLIVQMGTKTQMLGVKARE
jgi:hypothetical protein